MTIHGRTRAWILPTKREAAAKLREIQQARIAGVPVLDVGPTMTLGAWLDEWLATVRLSHPRTAPTYTHWVRHIRPALGHLPLTELTPSVLLEFFSEGLSSRLAPESRRHVYQVLHAALNVAVKRRLLYVNPLAQVPKPHGAQTERPTLTVDECRRLLETCAADRLGAIVVVALYSAAREGELLALGWRDVEWETGRISITKSLADVKGQGLTITPTKTRASRRVVSLPEEAMVALRRHELQQKMERLAAPQWSGDLVFATTTGTPIRRSNLLRRYWYPLLSRAGVPAIHFHDLRHTAALLMMRRGHLPAVSRRLGHASTSITTELYGHASGADDDRIAVGLADTLREPLNGPLPEAEGGLT